MKSRRAPLGTKNVVGARVTRLRAEHGDMKQWELMAQLQTAGINIGPASLSKLEGQTRPVTDLEIIALAKIFDVSADLLLGLPTNTTNK